jgi:hypothetical protein
MPLKSGPWGFEVGHPQTGDWGFTKMLSAPHRPTIHQCRQRPAASPRGRGSLASRSFDSLHFDIPSREKCSSLSLDAPRAPKDMLQDLAGVQKTKVETGKTEMAKQSHRERLSNLR